jgi:methylenetetrahydrofolate dehydrogenase (NADP+) / methenyltetrahydrofolate cyclohydrolase
VILWGKPIAEKIELQIRETIQALQTKPGLAVILIGQHPPSKTYVALKQKACQKVGIHSLLFEFLESIREEELLSHIEKLNQDPAIHGILLQFPLPAHLNPLPILAQIAPEKDIDGFHPINLGKLLLGDKTGFTPCTPLGIQRLLQECEIPIAGKDVVILGRGQTVGKPLSALLMQKGSDATVTVVHRETQDPVSHLKRADILIAAIGSPHFVKAEMVKEGAVVIDVGNNRQKIKDSDKWRIVGDVDFENVSKKSHAITPVPGGVGPLTVAMLLHNTLQSYIKHHL